MTSFRKQIIRRESFPCLGTSYCGYTGEKVLADICPHLLAGISLQTRRHVLNASSAVQDIIVDTTTSSARLQRHGSSTRDLLKESALLILCDKVTKLIVILNHSNFLI